jgi:hypothetical protein
MSGLARRTPRRGFGEVGVERTESGHKRLVMFIGGEQVLVLATDVPEDGFVPGLVTYAIKGAEWGVKSDIETAEMLDIYSKDPKNPPELLP